jgi:hypothetical protein
MAPRQRDYLPLEFTSERRQPIGFSIADVSQINLLSDAFIAADLPLA